MLCVVFPQLGNAAVVTLRADFWCPFNCHPDSAAPGFMVEIAQYGLARYGHTVDYQIIPWNRALKETREGKVDGVIAELKSNSPELVYPERELALTVNSFWVKKGSPWRYNGINSLRSVTLGLVQGYAFGEPLDSYVQKNQENALRVEMVRGEQAVARNLKKLLMGRIDVYLDAQLTVLYHAANAGQADQIERAGILNATPLYIGFSPKRSTSPSYARMVAEGIDELRATGKLNTILAKYGTKDWKEAQPPTGP